MTDECADDAPEAPGAEGATAVARHDDASGAQRRRVADADSTGLSRRVPWPRSLGIITMSGVAGLIGGMGSAWSDGRSRLDAANVEVSPAFVELAMGILAEPPDRGRKAEMLRKSDRSAESSEEFPEIIADAEEWDRVFPQRPLAVDILERYSSDIEFSRYRRESLILDGLPASTYAEHGINLYTESPITAALEAYFWTSEPNGDTGLVRHDERHARWIEWMKQQRVQQPPRLAVFVSTIEYSGLRRQYYREHRDLIDAAATEQPER